jgi:hypothetical protein
MSTVHLVLVIQHGQFAISIEQLVTLNTTFGVVIDAHVVNHLSSLVI